MPRQNPSTAQDRQPEENSQVETPARRQEVRDGSRQNLRWTANPDDGAASSSRISGLGIRPPGCSGIPSRPPCTKLLNWSLFSVAQRWPYQRKTVASRTGADRCNEASLPEALDVLLLTRRYQSYSMPGMRQLHHAEKQKSSDPTLRNMTCTIAAR
jgi:hypothetical protein